MDEFESIYPSQDENTKFDHRIKSLEMQIQTANPSNVSAEVVRTLKNMTRRIYIGTGADGNANFDGVNAVTGATLSGNTYTLTQDVNYNNVVVATDVVVVTRQYLLFVKGSMANNGTVYSTGISWW